MILNSRLQTEQFDEELSPILLIHGLFGSLDNLGVLARHLKSRAPVVQVDVRNHGHSPRAAEMSYAAMARDMLDTLDHLQLGTVNVIGHSMGGKIAMAMSALAPARIKRLVMIDIAPVDYQIRRHDDIFAALRAVSQAAVTRRDAAAELMRPILRDEMVINFLLKSFHQGEWLFNVPALWENYTTIAGWETCPCWPHPALFIGGGASPYLDPLYRTPLLAQFPCAKAHIIAGAGHWVHAEKPVAVLNAVQRFLYGPQKTQG
ncbi:MULTISPECIES: esterase [Tatumella]|uniref:Esterase n=1 Tax=Tatumella punctata TaxID=399969 RepID=A0ABW1VMQ5_9GAMM|nr:MULTISPECIES: esterase [unclassified Tatumella]MBS0854604.1 esterase [Tatumella sp. JGM16]MBS0875873.1 esterase [Tatumella sp. JGM82]MBS0890278.1 esterase [Tatumella sp. JGM94]MBS0894220.1 esterase [Tatumella sp. JGM130]MBS0900404.1 esterase [Tatumella sp. JGM100]